MSTFFIPHQYFHKKISTTMQKEGGARCSALSQYRPLGKSQGTVAFGTVRSASAAVVAASVQKVCAIAASAAEKQENQNPHAAVVAKTVSASIVSASAAAGEQKDDPDPVTASACRV